MEKKFKPPFCRKGWKKIIVLSYCYTQEALTHPHAIITSSNGQLLLYPYAQTQAPSAECVHTW